MTRTELTNAKQALIAAGWTHCHSVSSDQPNAPFGLCFIKYDADGKVTDQFYLNKYTFDRLPV